MKKTYIVNVHYTMIHQMVVEAENDIDALNIAQESFCEESDFSDDEMDGIDDACVVDVLED